MEQYESLIGTVLAVGAGIFVILASALNWDFFFEDKKAEFFIKILGRQGTRIFYAALGLFLFFIAYKIQAT